MSSISNLKDEKDEVMIMEFTYVRLSYPIQGNANVLESDVLHAIKTSLPSELAWASSTAEVTRILLGCKTDFRNYWALQKIGDKY